MKFSPAPFLPLALGALAGAGASLLAPSPALAVTLVHTNDLLGELEPCGCRSNPLGGVVREDNLLQKRLGDTSRVTVDAGDLLFPTDTVPDALVAQSKLQATELLKALDLLHYDAIVPGEKDFALGLKAFEELTRRSKARFLVANLKPRKGKSPFQAHLILNKKQDDGSGLKVALFGIVGKDLRWPRELSASDPIRAAKKEVASLRKKADLIIALSHLGLDEDRKLAGSVPGIDIIVGAHSQSFLQTPIQVQHTWIYQSSFRNQYVGIVPLKKSFKSENYELMGLDAGYDSPVEAPTAMNALVKDFKAGVARLNSTEDARNEARLQPQGDAAAHFQTFPRCAECHLKQFDFWRKTAHAAALAPLIEKEQFKNKECLTCHTVGLGKPSGFDNVNKIAAIKTGETDQDETLSARDLAAYLKAMHGANSLKSDVKLKPGAHELSLEKSLTGIAYAWTPVQCENCHAPGEDHPFTPGYAKTVGKAVCLSCHTPERAPAWFTPSNQPNWELIEAKRKLVTCPAGDVEADQ